MTTDASGSATGLTITGVGPLEVAQLQGSQGGASEKELLAAAVSMHWEKEFATPTETRPRYAGRRKLNFQLGASHVEEDALTREEGWEREER